MKRAELEHIIRAAANEETLLRRLEETPLDPALVPIVEGRFHSDFHKRG